MASQQARGRGHKQPGQFRLTKLITPQAWSSALLLGNPTAQETHLAPAGLEPGAENGRFAGQGLRPRRKEEQRARLGGDYKVRAERRKTGNCACFKVLN